MSAHRKNWSHYLGGILLIVIGVGFLLEKLGVLHGSIWTYWPVILIIIGIGMLFDRK